MTLFSICLPVRNGWPYIQECVGSILAQTYPHFELVVLDNNSSDQTLSWLRTIKDERVIIRTSDTSLTITESWARVLDLEKQEFMTLIGHDDLLDSDFLAAIVALIEKHPDAAIYQTGSRLINSGGGVIRKCRPVSEIERTDDYLRTRFTFARDVFGTGSVMRSRQYDQVGGIFDFEKLLFADDALWLSLMKDSYKATDPAELFSVRVHPRSESASLPSSWPSLVHGLLQFHGFMIDFVRQDKQAREVTRELGSEFFLAYLRNLYILAMIEASEAGRPLNEAACAEFEVALRQFGFDSSTPLSGSLKVRLIEMLSWSPARLAIPGLWRLYRRLRLGT